MKKPKQKMKKAKKVKRYIGIDLHTDCFTFCMLQEGSEPETHTFLLKGGLDRFVEMLRPDDELAIESTGNSRWFRERVQDHVARVVVVAPGEFKVIRHSAKKTDKNDAKAIAFFLSKGMLPESRVKTKVQADLLTAIRLRDQMTKQKVQCVNTAYALFNARGIKIKKKGLASEAGLKRAIDGHEWNQLERGTLIAIEKQLNAILEHRKELDAEIEATAKTLRGYENLVSIKGVSMLSATTFLITIGDIRDFRKPGNLAAYFGITPRVSQSNDTQHVGRITKRGNRTARTRLVQCTLSAIKYSPYLRRFYDKIKSKRGAAGKAIIATARKLLNTIFYTLRENWVFEDFPNFELKACN